MVGCRGRDRGGGSLGWVRDGIGGVKVDKDVRADDMNFTRELSKFVEVFLLLHGKSFCYANQFFSGEFVGGACWVLSGCLGG